MQACGRQERTDAELGQVGLLEERLVLFMSSVDILEGSDKTL